MRIARSLAAAAALLAVAGCDVYDKPNRPVPDDLEFRTLDGEKLRRSDLVGKPWVINIWVPG